jgi:hypothetical protein
MRYFAVTCKHGHHGAKNYYPITFAVAAETAIEACDYARAMPGVKHDQTVIGCQEISYETYAFMRTQSAYERAGFK